MRLYTSATSPFARAVRVAALERGVHLELEASNPFGADTEALRAANPLGRVPALVDGERLIHDSRVIVRYLDRIGDAPALDGGFDGGGFDDEVRVATGHGVMEAALLWRLEVLRDSKEQSAAFIARQRDRILRTTAALAPGAEARFTPGDVYVACALAYLDFRHPTLDWRAGNPALAEYAARVSERASMVATAFPES